MSHRERQSKAVSHHAIEFAALVIDVLSKRCTCGAFSENTREELMYPIDLIRSQLDILGVSDDLHGAVEHPETPPADQGRGPLVQRLLESVRIGNPATPAD